MIKTLDGSPSDARCSEVQVSRVCVTGRHTEAQGRRGGLRPLQSLLVSLFI